LPEDKILSERADDRRDQRDRRAVRSLATILSHIVTAAAPGIVCAWATTPSASAARSGSAATAGSTATEATAALFVDKGEKAIAAAVSRRNSAVSIALEIQLQLTSEELYPADTQPLDGEGPCENRSLFGSVPWAVHY
jgi:hypothetical protein